MGAAPFRATLAAPAVGPRIRARRGAWRPQFTPKLQKRTALLRELKRETGLRRP